MEIVYGYGKQTALKPKKLKNYLNMKKIKIANCKSNE